MNSTEGRSKALNPHDRHLLDALTVAICEYFLSIVEDFLGSKVVGAIMNDLELKSFDEAHVLAHRSAIVALAATLVRETAAADSTLDMRSAIVHGRNLVDLMERLPR